MKILNTLLILSILIIGIQPSIKAQSPYKLSWKLDAPMAAVSIGLHGSALALKKKIQPLTVADLMALDRDNLWAIDRTATYNWSRTAAHISDGFLYAGILSPTLLFLDKDIRKDAGKVTAMAFQTIALSTGLTNLTKHLVKRTRPFNYNPNTPMSYKEKIDARLSFFSGHTSATASMTFFAAKVYHDYHAGERSRIWVWSTAAVVPAITGYLRWKAGKHYFTDIITGYVVGALVGIIVPELHKRIH